MDEQYVREKITKLRIEKGISERQMSLDLGHAEGYINGISSGRKMPSIGELLYICNYLHIEPTDFFRADKEITALKKDTFESMLDLTDDDVAILNTLIKRLKDKK